MSVTEICNIVKVGDVKNALRHVQAWESKNPQDFHLVLLKLNSICYKNIPELSARGVTQDVFSLADLLCKTVSSSAADFPKIIQPLYHITNYLLKHDPLLARDLCKYFFQVDSLRARRNTVSTKEEQAVYYNLVHIFSSKLLDRFNRLKISSGEDTVESWLEFTFRLSMLRNNDALPMVFRLLHSILLKHDGNRLSDYLKLCFLKLNKWLGELAESKEGNSTRIVESFAGLVQVVLALVPQVKDFVIQVQPMVGCIAKIQAWCSESRGALVILESALLFCQTLENQSGAVAQSAANYHLDCLSSTVAKRPPKMNSVLPIVHTLLYTSRHNLISAKDAIQSHLTEIFSVLLALSELASRMNEKEGKKFKKHLEVAYIAFTVLKGCSPSKETLVSMFSNVRKFVVLFCNTAPHADKKSTHFSATVAELLNVTNMYKRAELFVESALMCQYMFRVFLEMDPDFLHGDSYFKHYVTEWLKSWASSCVNNLGGIDAQILLIIFAQRHPKFTIEAMKAWANLKKKVPAVKTNLTVLDILKTNLQEIEQNYPSFKMVDFDIGRLLLGEAYAYSKSRDLYGEPVLNVYKAAAKETKKNYIALANILCCTVDAFTFDAGDKKVFATLDASVSNMIAHLHKVERDIELLSERAALFCSLGNLYYYKARLERQRIRQKAEAEVSEEKSDAKLPVIRTGEKDALDITEIVAIGSSLKMSNSKVMEVLGKAMECWAECVDTLEPNVLLSPSLPAIKSAGYLLRLYGYKEMEASCWNNLFHVAAKLGSEKHQFLAAGELLAVRRTIDPEIIRCVEGLKFDRRCYAYHLYRINFAKNLLLQGNVDECRKAIDKIDSQSLLCAFLVNAQFKILLALFNMSRPAGVEIDKPPLALFTSLFENLMYLIVNNRWETHNEATVVQLLVMETAHLLSTIHSDLKYIRPARSYIKCGLPLSKKLALPARVCQVMTLGCWVDLLTWNVTESEINAQEVESLLELGVLKLGNHDTVCSPRRDSGLKIVPHFLSNKDCKCQSCLVTDYPCLVLDAISNRVLVLIGNDGHREAVQVIGIGMKVLEFIKAKEAAAQTLSIASCSEARFYYVVASASALWQKHEEAIRYATVAARSLDAAPVKNVGLDISIKRLVLGVRWTLSYKRPIKPKPMSRRFAPSQASIKPAVTPEAVPSVKAGTCISNIPKHAEKGYYDVGEREKLARKSLYSREENKEGCGIEELEGISKLSVSPVPTFGNNGKPTKTYLRVPSATEIEPRNECSNKNSTPETGISDVLMFAKKLDRPSKTQAKTNLFFKDAHNQLHAGGSKTPERTGDSKADVCTPPNPLTVEASSARKLRVTEKKPKVPKANILGTPCMASLARIGISAQTPAIKVYYDPEGLESTAKKQKSRSTIKKPKRLATKGPACEKMGTPKATRTRVAKEVAGLDDDSSDEIELVSAQFKRLLAHKEPPDDKAAFKKPLAVGKYLQAEEEKASTRLSECPPTCDDVSKDDTGSTDSFHSTLTTFDETFDSLPSMKKPLTTYSKKGAASEPAPVPSSKENAESNDSFFSLCSDDFGIFHSSQKPVICSSGEEARGGKPTGAIDAHKKEHGGPESLDGEQEAADDFDLSGVVVAPFRKVLAKAGKTARPVIQETTMDVTNEESDHSESNADGKDIAAKSAVSKPSRSCNPRGSIPEKVKRVPPSSALLGQTRTRKARRAIFDDTADICDADCLPEGAGISGKYAAKPSKLRKPRLTVGRPDLGSGVLEAPGAICATPKTRCAIASSKNALSGPELHDDKQVANNFDSSEVLAAPFRKVLGKTVKTARPVIEDSTMDMTDSDKFESNSTTEEHVAEKFVGHKPSISSNSRRLITEMEDESESSVVIAPTRTRKARRAIFDDTAESQTAMEVISHSASGDNRLLGQATVGVSNKNAVDEVAAISLAKQGAFVEAAKSGSSKAGSTNLTMFAHAVNENDSDASMVVVPFRKLAWNGRSGVVSKAKPVIHDETIDQDQVEGRGETAPSVNDRSSTMRKTTKAYLSKTFSKKPEYREEQNLETIESVAPKKMVGTGDSVQPTTKHIEARVPKAVPSTAEVRKRVGRTRSPGLVGLGSAIAGSSKATSLTTSRGLAPAATRPKRVARAASKEPQAGGSKPLAKSAKPAKTLLLKIPSPNACRKSPDRENVDPATSPSLIDLSVVESSFVETSSDMKLPLTARYLAEEMNKLSISSKPARQPSSTNAVRETRQNGKK